MEAKERANTAAADEAIGSASERPLLMVDIDGVISLFGIPMGYSDDEPAIAGSLHSIDGAPHFLSATAAGHLLELLPLYELVWASGWEERANDHLPHLLGLPRELPFLRFERDVGGHGGARAHWKLEAIEDYARGRPLAWIDDALNEACHEWAEQRGAPTLLVQTRPEHGLTEREARELSGWASALER
jgi:hypothetical protein